MGGLASFVATGLEVRSRRTETAAARQVKLADTRRELYGVLIERADVLTDAARDVSSYVNAADVPDEVEERYLTAWELMVQARASVEIVGPASAASAATKLYGSVTEICNQIDDWLSGEQWTAADEAAYEQKLDGRRESRAAFVAVAQKVVSTAE